MTVTRYRKRPIEVDTIQWTGDNEAEVQAFTGDTSTFYAIDAADREGSDDPEATATVYDRLHSTWVLVYTGQHIVRGVKGEFYPIAEDVLAETYELVKSGPEATGYCPACGRGDVAPTAGEYEQQRQRAEQAEASIARVRNYAVSIERSSWTGPAIARRIREALDGTEQPTATAAEQETTTRVFAALHQSAEQDVTRVIDLYERWVKAGPPPLGTPMARWWDARLVELHDAIRPPADQPKEK